MSINRNIVECKFRKGFPAKRVTKVLIETLWNVNLCFLMIQKYMLIVLIETLWNVNELSPFKKLNADNGY